jgi:hypothetical protein
MSYQTQLDLLNLAQKHKKNLGVSILLLSITESTGLVKSHIYSLGLEFSQVTERLDEGRVPASNNLVELSSKVNVQLCMLSKHYMDLATLLQKLGETITY